MAPSPRDQAPAAQTTVSVAIAPLSVTTCGDGSPAGLDRGDRAAADQTRARPPRGSGVAVDDALGGAVPVRRRVRGREESLGADQGRERLGLRDVDEPAGDAQLVLQGDVLLERLDVLGLLQEEQVADLVQVDLLAERGLERLERAQAARPELDVDRVGELGAHPAGGLAGGTGAELALLDQDDVGDPGAGQVVGGAESHDTAADDHDGGAGRKCCRWHLSASSPCGVEIAVRRPGRTCAQPDPATTVQHKRRRLPATHQGC